MSPGPLDANSGEHSPNHLPDGCYRDSPSPMGATGTTILLSIPLVALSIGLSLVDDPIQIGLSAWDWLVITNGYFVGIYVASFVFNLIPSQFEGQRKILNSKYGGIFFSILIWSAPPATRILFYEDAVELRTAFQRYLLPYARITAELEPGRPFLSPRAGTLLHPLVIRSDLAGVPNRLKFVVFNSQEVLELIQRHTEKVK